MKIYTLLLALLSAASIAAAPGNHVANYEQEPGHFGGFGSDNSFAVADEFLFDQDVLVRRVVWWGDGTSKQTPDHFTIRIFADDEGAPGALLVEIYDPQIRKHRTGKFLNAPDLYPEYEYTLDLDSPFAAQAETKYWLSIVKDGGFLWEVSGSTLNLGVQRAVFTDPVYGPWTPYLDNTAFQLDVRH